MAPTHDLSTSAAPKPSIVLLVCSVLVLAACISLISAAIAALTVTWDPCSVIGGAIALPLPAVLATQQYCAAFRQDSKAAWRSAVLLFIVGGFGLLGFVMTLGEMLLEGVRLSRMSVSLLSTMLAVGVLGCLAGWMDLRWSRRMKLAASPATESLGRTRFSAREVMAAVVAVACATALAAYEIRSMPPRYAENVSRDMAPFGLPAGARDVSFCQGVRGAIAYEFTIDEKGFIEWVESGIGSIESDSSNVTLKPITTPYKIPRYYALTSDLAGPSSITVTTGVFYHWSKEDRGVYAVFDRATNRAYYHAYFH